MHKKIILFYLLCSFWLLSFSQKENAVYFKGAIKENRDKLRQNILQHNIKGNLSLPVNGDTEESWIDAFGVMELIQFKSDWAESRIRIAFDSLDKRSTNFQRALLELAYSGYAGRFTKQVTALLYKTTDAKIFAMCAEYLMVSNPYAFSTGELESKQSELIKNDKDAAIIDQLFYRIKSGSAKKNNTPLSIIMSPDFLKGNTILYSLQRKNRNYPGIALIRDSAGKFVKDSNDRIFYVPQLARSISNLPGYLTNGNTPEGIFRMYGLDTSKGFFIGPTANIQLTMPVETTIQHFLNDSTITDTVWTEEWYRKLLPESLENFRPLYGSYYAGKAGRTEIIAHGTTVDPEFYAGEKYYPQTPTIGCLCTKEIWSDKNGKRLESDQQKLVNALQSAGGANGYCVVIEIDDSQKPVTIHEILPLLKQAGQK